MKLPLIRLLLLCIHSPQSVSSDSLVVTQTPDVSVLEGKKVEVHCCWRGSKSRVGVKWLINQTSVMTEIVPFQSEESPNVQASHCSHLVFKKITCKDSGRYVCKVAVEIPLLTEVEGNGTSIMVIHREDTDHHTADDKENKDRKPSTNDDDNTRHYVENENKEATIRKPKVSTDDNTISISNGGENTAKKPCGTNAETNHRTSNDDPQYDVFVFVMRCLPILALITAFVWLYHLGTKAQQNTSAALTNEPTSAKSTTDDQGEHDPHEGDTEEAKA